ncbi:4'-phosphopantetheinyl transferase family protein [Geodermatophilus maliterrae]|uniref:4'-phosphopantetheinyl transferase superfamily protein n=1 Tax=Geodermatophilus maliterrae TaxID=3162531 RepID=A0ABV3X9Z9_9ACTN
MWWAAPVPPERAGALVALLDVHERARLERLRRPDDRARHLAAHALARLALGAVLGAAPAGLQVDRTCRCGGQHGKPRLVGDRLPGFSLTHSGDVVGVAVSTDHLVGLDVERRRAIDGLDELARHVRAPGEDDSGDFFTTWTRKEALLKATGDGLATPMADLELGPGPRLVRWGGARPRSPMWVRDLVVAPGHCAAIAGIGVAAPPVEVRDGAALLAAAGA